MRQFMSGVHTTEARRLVSASPDLAEAGVHPPTPTPPPLLAPSPAETQVVVLRPAAAAKGPEAVL
jgi:hypothetical protein